MPSGPAASSLTRMIEPPQGTCALIFIPGLAGTPTGKSAPVIRPSDDLTLSPVWTMSRQTGSCGVVPKPSLCLVQNGSFGLSVQPWLSGSANPLLLGNPSAKEREPSL